MKLYAKVITILALPLIWVVTSSLYPVRFPSPGWALTIAQHSPLSPHSAPIQEPDAFLPSNEYTEAPDTTDTVPSVAVDTARQRILFFGDSMVEGLVRRMADYAEENGHDLIKVVWYASTTQQWATTDTLQFFIRKYDPTFFIVCIGGNEQFVRDLPKREGYIQHIIGDMGGKPFVWIGVPAWKEDTGFNSLVQRCVGEDRYFNSRRLTLKRGTDRMHPTFSAAEAWMDSIAAWMRTGGIQHPILMETPAVKATRHYPLHLLQPVKK